MRATSTSLLLVLFLVLVSGCASNATDPEGMWRQTMKDFRTNRGTGGFRDTILQRAEKRYAIAIDLQRSGRLTAAEDQLYAAALLLTSDDPEHVDLAKELALASAEQGEQRAWPVLAEATDKALVIQGLVQRYGTHLAFNFALGRWQLYAVDPATTDAEREAMGLPPLAELRARAESRDAQPITDLLLEAQSHR